MNKFSALQRAVNDDQAPNWIDDFGAIHHDPGTLTVLMQIEREPVCHPHESFRCICMSSDGRVFIGETCAGADVVQIGASVTIGEAGDIAEALVLSARNQVAWPAVLHTLALAYLALSANFAQALKKHAVAS